MIVNMENTSVMRKRVNSNMTGTTTKAATKFYTPNYPRPQFVRSQWLDLNGEWDFSFDDDHAGIAARWMDHFPATHTINVPFTYETAASGIGEETFHPRIWYRKQLVLSPAVEGSGRCCILKAWIIRRSAG